jgi:hypothetical protein
VRRAKRCSRWAWVELNYRIYAYQARKYWQGFGHKMSSFHHDGLRNVLCTLASTSADVRIQPTREPTLAPRLPPVMFPTRQDSSCSRIVVQKPCSEIGHDHVTDAWGPLFDSPPRERVRMTHCGVIFASSQRRGSITTRVGAAADQKRYSPAGSSSCTRSTRSPPGDSIPISTGRW